MRLLHAGVDLTVIALWLGDESTDTTQVYLHADVAIKERALARPAPPVATTHPAPRSPSSNSSNRRRRPPRLPDQAGYAKRKP